MRLLKKHSRTTPDVQFKEFYLTKQKTSTEGTMSELRQPFRKKIQSKIDKTVKIKVKLPHVNKKPLERKRISVQTLFSHSTLKLEQTNFKPQNHSLYSSTSCFGVTINYYSNLTSKIMKMCEQILRQRPNRIQILWIVKNNDVLNSSRYRSRLLITKMKIRLKKSLARSKNALEQTRKKGEAKISN